MKEYHKTLFLMIWAAAFVMAIGCSSNNNPVENQTSAVDFESGEFAVFGAQDIMDEIEDATLDSDMRFNPDLFNGRFFRDGGRFGRRGPRGPFGLRALRDSSGNHLKLVLRDLTLSDEQIDALRSAMNDFRTCIEAPLQSFLEANQEILDAANQERRTIRDSVRAGELTREEARELIKALNERTHEAIENNPESQEALQAICDCQLELFDTIRALLDETQQATWDEWIGGLSGSCFN